MSKLHHQRVRRARGLPMPLPPKPKARPLGPPVILYWGSTPIRMRSDIERAGRTWDEFLDAMAGLDVDYLEDPHADFLAGPRGCAAVRALAPERERAATMGDFFGRVHTIREQRREEKRARLQAFEEAREEAHRAVQASQSTRSLISRLFGRAA